ncbi:MAG: hypothetical protein JWM28_1619 [Chitinophagaceae bacterium]|nr:hypothetical protein [Chitinophagaceae bacterium]
MEHAERPDPGLTMSLIFQILCYATLIIYFTTGIVPDG